MNNIIIILNKLDDEYHLWRIPDPASSKYYIGQDTAIIQWPEVSIQINKDLSIINYVTSELILVVDINAISFDELDPIFNYIAKKVIHYRSQPIIIPYNKSYYKQSKTI